MYTLIESGQSAYLGEDLPGEYAYSEYSKHIRNYDQVKNRAKGRVVGSLGELIEISTNRRWEKTKHIDSKDALYGIYLYDVSFAFPTLDDGSISSVKAFDAEILIRNASDRKKYLYDIVHIKENTAIAQGLLQQVTRSGPKAATRDSVSMNSVAQEVGESNTGSENFSVNSGDRYSITSEFADWFEAQTWGKLAVSQKYLDSEDKPVYDASRTVDDRAGVLELARQNRELRQELADMGWAMLDIGIAPHSEEILRALGMDQAEADLDTFAARALQKIRAQ